MQTTMSFRFPHLPAGPQNARIVLPRLLCRVGPVTSPVIQLCSPVLSFACCAKPLFLFLSVASMRRAQQPFRDHRHLSLRQFTPAVRSKSVSKVTDGMDFRNEILVYQGVFAG